MDWLSKHVIQPLTTVCNELRAKFEVAVGQKQKREPSGPQEERGPEPPAKRGRFKDSPARHVASTPAPVRERTAQATPWNFQVPASAAPHHGLSVHYAESPLRGAQTPRAAPFTSQRQTLMFKTPAANAHPPLARGTDWHGQAPPARGTDWHNRRTAPSSIMPAGLGRTPRAPATPYGERIHVPPWILTPEQLAAARREEHMRRAGTGQQMLRSNAQAVRHLPTLEATQGQILSQSPTDATRFWWRLYGS